VAKLYSQVLRSLFVTSYDSKATQEPRVRRSKLLIRAHIAPMVRLEE
jgi:hypothetical protein